MRGTSGWSSFTERDVKCIVDWLLRIVYEESLLYGGQYVIMFVISLV